MQEAEGKSVLLRKMQWLNQRGSDPSADRKGVTEAQCESSCHDGTNTVALGPFPPYAVVI